MTNGLGALTQRRLTRQACRLAVVLLALGAGFLVGCGSGGGGGEGDSQAQSQPRYEATAVGPAGRVAAAQAVNDSGLVVGSSEDSAQTTGRAFRWQVGQTRELNGRFAWDVNGAGAVVGESGGIAYLWDGDAGVRPLAYGVARGINDRGQVVGEAASTEGCVQAFLWQEGELAGLGALGGCWSAAYDVNGAGQVVGWAETADGRLVAFRWEAGVMIGLGTLGGATSMAYGINGHGQAVGYSATTAGADRAFLADADGFLLDLGSLTEGGYSVAYGIDDAGRVVGEASASCGHAHAFLWQDGRMLDLNALLPLGSGWELSRAFSINAAGQIAGQGTYQGEKRAFLLTPAP